MSREDGKTTMAARARAVIAKEFWRWWKTQDAATRRKVVADVNQARELEVYITFAIALRRRIQELDAVAALERADQETVFRRILPDLPSFLKTLEVVKEGMIEAQVRNGDRVS